MRYKDSGVDIEEGYRAVDGYRAHAERTQIPGVLSGLGAFAGMFELPQMQEPVLVSGTDGVGTKLELAASLGRYGSVGIDCVAMSVNDILCSGARPLFFLDYIACGRLDASVAVELVKGIADGCAESGCALLGGETAEMPGFYADGRYDVAGFALGIVEKKAIIDGSNIEENDVILGLSSSGLHSNGFSLVRRLVSDLSEPFEKGTIGEELLKPTRIYVRPVLAALERFPHAIHGMAHITGGGFYENIPRAFTALNKKRAARREEALGALIEKGSWQVPAIFDELVRRGADSESLFNTFNMGIGFVLIADHREAESLIRFFNEYAEAEGAALQSLCGMKACAIGRAAPCAEGVRLV